MNIRHFQSRISFLRQIPEDIISTIDTREFLYPTQEINSLRHKLEKLLNCHIMTYKHNKINLNIPLQKHLCSNLESAKLTPQQCRTLHEFEQRARDIFRVNINFVAYKKPLDYIPLSQSPLAKYYSSHNSSTPALSTSTCLYKSNTMS